MHGWTPEAIAGLITAVAGLATAIGALMHSHNTRKAVISNDNKTMDNAKLWKI